MEQPTTSLKGDTGFDYIGRCTECDAICAATAECEATKATRGATLQEWMDQGMYVERVPVAYLREHGFGICRCAEIVAERSRQQDAAQLSLF